ncbi:MAG: uroporphyrinogen decarboxylase family protein [Planctomycetota bacterium]|jgi:uroporphyrinogen-III decarboxylase
MPNAEEKQSSKMTHRQRLLAAINHKPLDRVCVDFGACTQTGIGAGAVHKIRKALLGDDSPVKVIEPYQMLGEIDDQLMKALDIDVAGVIPPNTMFGFKNESFKPFQMFDGTPVLVPEKFKFTTSENGDLLMHPQGDTSVPPSAKMPKGGFYFDALNRQLPIVEEDLDPKDNCEEFGLLSEDDINYFAQNARRLYENTDYGVMITIPGTAFGDIALVPATWLKHPKGIRDVEEWYVSTITRKDYVRKVFETQCEFALKNIERLADAVGEHAHVAWISGTDFGTQRGLFISPGAYRELFKPFHKKVNDLVHQKTNWKTFIHSCGAVYELIPEFIDAGFDILNPVQCSADGMDPKRLKEHFGSSIVFWGGGVDTQKTLPFGTPDEVYSEVRQRIDVLNENSGFVFNAIHNVQSNVPVENILALFRAIKDSYK